MRPVLVLVFLAVAALGPAWAQAQREDIVLTGGCALRFMEHGKGEVSHDVYWFNFVDASTIWLKQIKQQHPGSPLVAHPECTRAVRMLADEVCSPEKMISYCRENPAKSFIIATESGMLNRLRRELPDKEFIPGPTDRCACADCRYMKMNTLEKVHDALKDETPELVMEPALREKALVPLQRMLDWSRN